MGARFCANCGASLAVGAHFCERCGDAVTDAALPSAPVQRTGKTVQLGTATATATKAAGIAATAAALPWQTLVEGDPVDLDALATAAGVPVARHAIQRSLRRPGIAMAVTAVLDLFVTAVSGAGVTGLAIPRFALGLVTAALAIASGARPALRRATGLVSLVTALVQVVTSGLALANLPEGTGAATMATMVVASSAALVTAALIARDALRSPS